MFGVGENPIFLRRESARVAKREAWRWRYGGRGRGRGQTCA